MREFREQAHLHRLAAERAARPATTAAWRSSTAPAGTTATKGRPRPWTPPPTRSPSPWPGCSPARTGANASSAGLGRARRIHRRTTPHRRPRLHLGTTARPPGGAATEKTRCSNDDCTPAASHSSRPRPAMPGTCPRPSSRHPTARPATEKPPRSGHGEPDSSETNHIGPRFDRIRARAGQSAHQDRLRFTEIGHSAVAVTAKMRSTSTRRRTATSARSRSASARTGSGCAGRSPGKTKQEVRDKLRALHAELERRAAVVGGIHGPGGGG